MTGRTIPFAMVGNLQDAAPRWCFLWKVTPLQPGLSIFGLTSWDFDIVYDDLSGDGPITYKAKRGFNSYAIETSADLAVDNSEMEVLIAEYDFDGITASAISRGDYDDGRFIEYMVNPDDLSEGHTVFGSGNIGRQANIDGLTGVIETRSLTQILKQKSIIELGSNNCRATMGDPRCGYPVDTLWDGGEVSDVGLETDREFTPFGSSISTEDDFYVPGIAEFLSGANAGRTYEIESFVGGVVILAIPTEEPISEFDQVRIRPNCTNLWGDAGTEHNSCLYFNNRPNFRGEPKRPVSESYALQSPGAASNTMGAGSAEGSEN